MKFIPKHLLLAATAACFASAVNAQPSHAGQWLDSLFGRPQPAYPVGTPVPVNGQVAAYSPGVYPQAGYVPPAYSNLRTPQVAGYGSYASPPTYNAPLLAPGFPQTVAGQLPTAAYDTQWARTPVTYYRPVTAFDPRYGTTVTSLQPCTSYQYQAQRQPVIAPRPLLGDYGLQANRWPSITGPGYNPTGLANTAMYAPAVAPFQNIPNAGMQIANPPSAFAPTGVGVASGMPASTLPLTTMQYNPVVTSQPYVAQPYAAQTYAAQPNMGQQAAYYNGQNYNGQVIGNPAYASSVSAMPYNAPASQPIGSGVMPTAAWMPSTAACPNGLCPQQANTQSYPTQLAAPNIPGAVVRPVGPPTYSATPNPTYGNNGFTQPVNPGTGYNPAAAPFAPAFNPSGVNPVLPNGQILPSGGNNVDPEATRQPSLPLGGRQASSPSAGSSTVSDPASNSNSSPFQGQNSPIVAANRESTGKETTTQWKSSESFAKPRDTIAADPGIGRSTTVAPEIPDTLPPRVNYGMKPLSAPDDFDTKPRWNPTLLDPDDRTVMERSGLWAPETTKLAGRIRTLEESESAVAAVAFESTQSGRNNIQLVSGVEAKHTVSSKTPAHDQTIRFRPVATLK